MNFVATLTIKRILVLINTSGTDTVYLTADVPTAFPVMGYETTLKVEAQSGYGVDWVRKTFDREPDEVVDMKKNR